MGCAIVKMDLWGRDGDRFNGRRVRLARGARGLTQEALAAKTEIPPARLREIEDGADVDSQEVFVLCRILDFPLRFFFVEGPVGTTDCWICGSDIRTCSVPGCHRAADYLCDWPMGKGKTCDAPLCEHHRGRQAEEREIDYCPQHALMARSMGLQIRLPIP